LCDKITGVTSVLGSWGNWLTHVHWESCKTAVCVCIKVIISHLPHIKIRVTQHFTYGTLRLLDSSPTVWSFRLLDTSPTGHFAYETFRLLESLPIGQFAY